MNDVNQIVVGDRIVQLVPIGDRFIVDKYRDVLADGSLIVLGDKGTLLLVDAKPADYVERGRAQVFEGKTWTMPILSGGRLYLRDEHEMVAMKIAAAGDRKPTNRSNEN